MQKYKDFKNIKLLNKALTTIKNTKADSIWVESAFRNLFTKFILR
ncbi:MAG: hypothetical protein RJA07_1672 [Bacteroidota bacterium]|jgi:hypothetical protein